MVEPKTVSKGPAIGDNGTVPTDNESLSRVPVLDLLPHVCDLDSVMRRIDELIGARRGGYICLSTVHMVMESYDDPEFADKVNSAEIVIPDGMPLVWLQKLRGHRSARRIRGNDLMKGLIRYSAEKDLKVGFYGGSSDVVEAMRERVEREYPHLKLVYACAPPFRLVTDAEDAAIVDEINRADPDLLFVGLGCPKQENWMAAHRGRIRALMFGVGAAFDFYAGNVREAPVWLRNVGFEWFFRLSRDPRRLWKRYLVLNPRFVWHAARQLLGRSR